MISYTYDNERITPYSYSAYLDGAGVQVDYSLSHQSGIYRLQTACEGVPAYLLLNSRDGSLTVKGNSVIYPRRRQGRAGYEGRRQECLRGARRKRR